MSLVGGMEKMNPFDYLNAINSTKKDIMIDDISEKDYNAFGGNAYGLANTLSQTAIFKPKIINKKIKNLVYTGQLTVPGPGVPPSLISGKISAKLLSQTLK